jgi:hypothetical protein
LIHRRQQASILDTHSFRSTGCDTVHYLAVAKVRAQKSDMVLVLAARPGTSGYAFVYYGLTIMRAI